MRSGSSRISPRQRGISTVAVHATLAGLALIAAYVTWTRDRTQIQSDSVVVLDFKPRDVTSLVYEDEVRTVAVEKRSGEGSEPYAWVTVTTRSKDLVTHPDAMPAPGGPGMPPGMPPGHGGQPMPGVVPSGLGVRGPGGKPALPPGKGGEKAAGDKSVPVQPPHPPVGPAPAAAAPGPHGAAPAAPAAAPGAADDKTVTRNPDGSIALTAPGADKPIHEIKQKTVVKQFRGSDQGDKLFEQFGPLKALRALGQVDEKKAKELGFEGSKKTLTVSAKGQTIKFVLGSTSFGTGDSYARDPEGRVFLIPQRIIGDFEFAESRLMERRLHRFERADFDRIDVTVGGKTRSLLQQKRQDAANFYFTDARTPDQRDDTLRNWVDKVLRIAISDYVAQGEEPRSDGQAPVSGAPAYGEIATLRFFDGRKELGSAQFSRYPSRGQNEYYARTETTIGLVKLLTATAESAIQDAEKWQ